MTSPMVISTISAPPYLGTSFNDSSGFVLDLLKVIQSEGGIPEKFNLQVINEATPGLIGNDRWTGIVEDAKQKYTHFAVGPIFDNLFLAEQQIYFSHPWHKPQLKLVVRADSVLAKDGNLREGTYVDLRTVDLISVENSAELQKLSDFRMLLSEGLTKVQEEIRRKSPILVDNVCDGLRKLGVVDDKDEPVEGKRTPQERDQVLILNSLEADYYASGNKLLKIISPFYPPGQKTELGSFSFMSHLDFQKLNQNLNKVLGKQQYRINDLVKKWSNYDKDACKKLRKALSKGSSLGGTNICFSVLIAALVIVSII